jgi:hypothetical protein
VKALNPDSLNMAATETYSARQCYKITSKLSASFYSSRHSTFLWREWGILKMKSYV